MPKLKLTGTQTGRMSGKLPGSLKFEDIHPKHLYNHEIIKIYEKNEFWGDADEYDDYWGCDTQIETMLEFHEQELSFEKLLNQEKESSRGGLTFFTSIDWGVKLIYSQYTNMWYISDPLTQQLEFEFVTKPTIAESIENYKEFFQSKFTGRKKGKRRKYAK